MGNVGIAVAVAVGGGDVVAVTLAAVRERLGAGVPVVQAESKHEPSAGKRYKPIVPPLLVNGEVIEKANKGSPL
jgi:hypothetical protein